MLEQKTYTLPKRERLCAKTLIDQLFMGHSSVKKEWPVKVVYQVVKRKDAQDVPVEMLVSVSKRHFKRAVKRNHVKRQLRESYRLHKSRCQADDCLHLDVGADRGHREGGRHDAKGIG